jgi:hypothetical protein
MLAKFFDNNNHPRLGVRTGTDDAGVPVVWLDTMALSPLLARVVADELIVAARRAERAA